MSDVLSLLHARVGGSPELHARAVFSNLDQGEDMRLLRVLKVFNRSPQEPTRNHPLPVRDREFLRHVREIVGEHLSDPAFTTSAAAICFRMSRMHLNRKLRALTGLSTHQFIQTMRLDVARELVVQDLLSIAAIASRVGFRSASHFTKAFRSRYGLTPGKFQKQSRHSFLRDTHTQGPTLTA